MPVKTSPQTIAASPITAPAHPSTAGNTPVRRTRTKVAASSQASAIPPATYAEVRHREQRDGDALVHRAIGREGHAGEGDVRDHPRSEEDEPGAERHGGEAAGTALGAAERAAKRPEEPDERESRQEAQPHADEDLVAVVGEERADLVGRRVGIGEHTLHRERREDEDGERDPGQTREPFPVRLHSAVIRRVIVESRPAHGLTSSNRR